MRVAVVGATGVVGTTMLEILHQRQFPADEVMHRVRASAQGYVTKSSSVAFNANVTIDGERVLHSPGRLRDLQWSPDGHWLLTSWAGADHWLAVKATGQAHESAVSAVRHHFGAAERVRGWCC